MKILGFFALFVAWIVLSAPAASAESLCTDTWTGAAEGEWSEAGGWSAGHVPSSTDVACIGAGKTVKVAGSAAVTGVVQGSGTLVLQGASLEVASSLEPSVISTFRQTDGTLTGAGSVQVSSSLSWTEGTMAGSGQTVVKSGAIASFSSTSNKVLVTRTFSNEGTTTLSEGQVWMSSGARIVNAGTLYANSQLGIIVGSGEASIVNTGTFEKASGTGTTEVGPSFESTGTIAASTGLLKFTHPATLSSGKLEGKLSFTGSTTVGSINGEAATVTLSATYSPFDVNKGSTATIGTLLLEGGIVGGAGTLVITSAFTWHTGDMTGTGSAVLGGGATGTWEDSSSFFLAGSYTFVNEGTMTFSEGQLWMYESAKLENRGIFYADPSHLAITRPSGASPRIINEGLFEKKEGSGVTEIEPVFVNYGEVFAVPSAGSFVFNNEIIMSWETGWGGEENPSALGRESAICGEDVSCATGNLSKSQTDFSIAGRGVGLALTRTYNSQAAADGIQGVFGYGWSSSFADHLAIEVSQKRATLTQADGSTVVFTEGTGGVYTPPVWSQDTLTGSEAAGYTVTLADQTAYKFAGTTGRLESVTDRAGNATTIAYNANGKPEAITDPAGRKLKLAYNANGLVESVEDPMGHLVKYTYEGGNLASVTQPGETALRWQFKYDTSHQLTELVDGRGGKTTYEYSGSHQVLKETDPLLHVTKFEYEPFLTLTKNEATGAVTADSITSTGLASAVTNGYGTALATTQSMTYDGSGNELTVTDGNGHTTKYTYDSHSNKTSETDPEGNKTEWTYDGTHDILTETKPNAEKTTYEPSTYDPTRVSRPAPEGKTQETTYEYNSHGQVTKMTDPLGRVWAYGYDSYGDKSEEVDPEGDKRTFEYNPDSYEIATVSPRGNVTGGEPLKFTTKTERDAQGRPTLITEPESNATTEPVNVTAASIVGVPVEGATLSAAVGLWRGVPSPSYSYQWQRCDAQGGECASITGATGSTHAIVSADVMDTLRVVVSASNSYGSASSTSAPSAVVSAVAPLTYISSFGSGHLAHPLGVAVDSHGDVWVADGYGNDVKKFSVSGSLLATYGRYGTGNGEYREPVGIAINQSTGNVYIGDQNNDRVQELNEKGEWVRSWGSEGSGNGQFKEPEDVAIGASGHVFVTDWQNNRVEVFEENGTYLSKFGEAGSGNGQFSGPSYLAVSGGVVYVGDTNHGRIEAFSEAGAYLGQGGAWGTAIGHYEYPGGIAVNPEGALFIADTGNDRVQEWSSSAEFLSAFGTYGDGSAQFSEPEGLAFDSAGELFVSDAANNRIEQWAPPGAPRVLVAPTLSGEVLSGQSLSASTGTWSASPAAVYAYQWERCNSVGGSCAGISGATEATYTPGTADYGHRLRVAVKATNSAGSATSESPVTEVLSPARKTELAYDGDGNLEAQTDPEGHTTTYTYDADNERTKTKEPNGAVTETGYDGAGQITSQTDGNNHTTTYKRNILEQVVEVIDPLSRKTAKEYDAAGNLTSVTDALNRTTKYKYNADNRLTEISYSDGQTPAVKYEYNGDGLRTKMIDGSGATTYEYDQLDRLTGTKDGHGNTAAYEYDLANEQTKITYPNGKAVSRSFDNAGRLKGVTDWLGNTTSFGYDQNSNQTTTVFPTGTSNEDVYTFSDADKLVKTEMKKGTQILASLTYTLTNDDLLEATSQQGLPGEENTADTYDANKRLTKSGTTAYEYDAANNPAKIGSSTDTYNAADELESSTGVTYSYNEVGERTKTSPSSHAATSYGYDQAGNLIAVERAKEGETPAIEDKYAYNGDGLRVSRTSNSVTTYLAWDLAEGLPLILNDGTDSFIYGPEDIPIEQINNEEKAQYLHHDQQSSTRLITGSTGAVEGSYTYTPYGAVETHTGTATTTLGYDAQYMNNDTGLIYLRARSYDPATAQFLSVDPATETTRAPYTYALDSPLGVGDPTGLIPWGPKVRAAQAKCRSWKAWHSMKSPFYGNRAIYESCQDLLRLPSEVYGTGKQSGKSTGDEIDVSIQRTCDLSGPTALVALRRAPGVSGGVIFFCTGFSAGNVIRQALGL